VAHHASHVYNAELAVSHIGASVLHDADVPVYYGYLALDEPGYRRPELPSGQITPRLRDAITMITAIIINTALTVLCVILANHLGDLKATRYWQEIDKQRAWKIDSLVRENVILFDRSIQTKLEARVWRDAYKQSLPATEEAWRKAKLPADILKLLDCNTP
jgi:multisubunit Na+/H+ antiporter MnhC subunit